MTGGVDALAKIEGCADFFDGTPQDVAALAREDGAEGVDGDQNGDHFVIDAACSGERAVHRGKKRAEDADEKKLFEDDPAVTERVP